MPEKRQRKAVSWERTLKSIRRHEGWQHSVPSEKRLKEFEGLLGIQLPPTYRQFTKRFGAGQLSGLCEFFSCAAGLSTASDMFHQNLNHKRFVIESGNMADERARWLIVFGHIWSGEDFGWDCREVTKKGKRPEEYAIYAVARMMDTTTKLADSFPEFIAEFCMGDGLLNYTGLGKGEDPFRYARNEYSSRH